MMNSAPPVNQPPSRVIIDGTTPQSLLRCESGFVSCPLCGKTGPTITEHKIGWLAHLAAVMTCFTDPCDKYTESIDNVSIGPISLVRPLGICITRDVNCKTGLTGLLSGPVLATMMNKSKAQQQQQQPEPPPYQPNYGVAPPNSPLPEVNMPGSPWTPIPLLTTEPRIVHCQNCGKEGMTKTEAETGLVTWLSFCGLSMAGCVLGCCLIPFCVGRCKDVKHRCSSCHQVLARYERL